jgi:cytochrome b
VNTERSVQVWDPAVRIFHWSLAIAFFAAYLSGEELHALHEVMGYTILVLVIFRIIWGFIGPGHARFADFVHGPAVVLANLKDIVLMRPKRYLGHGPAAGAMVLLLLIMLAATTATGIIADEQRESAHMISSVGAADNEIRDEHEDEESLVTELHETLANYTLALVFVHVAGVLLASFTHRENLARSMVTGRKRG